MTCGACRSGRIPSGEILSVYLADSMQTRSGSAAARNEMLVSLGQLGSGSRDPTIRSILVGVFARRGFSNLDHDRRRDDDEMIRGWGVCTSSVVVLVERRKEGVKTGAIVIVMCR